MYFNKMDNPNHTDTWKQETKCCALEEYAVPAPRHAPVMLLLFQTRW